MTTARGIRATGGMKTGGTMKAMGDTTTATGG
jgi:hypothetical protein